jgi:hypothetical protein
VLRIHTLNQDLPTRFCVLSLNHAFTKLISSRLNLQIFL